MRLRFRLTIAAVYLGTTVPVIDPFGDIDQTDDRQ
jgi:hypothetical protein